MWYIVIKISPLAPPLFLVLDEVNGGVVAVTRASVTNLIGRGRRTRPRL
jgi:hypothetical protein